VQAKSPLAWLVATGLEWAVLGGLLGLGLAWAGATGRRLLTGLGYPWAGLFRLCRVTPAADLFSRF
jgi:hypothetical protein